MKGPKWSSSWDVSPDDERGIKPSWVHCFQRPNFCRIEVIRKDKHFGEGQWWLCFVSGPLQQIRSLLLLINSRLGPTVYKVDGQVISVDPSGLFNRVTCIRSALITFSWEWGGWWDLLCTIRGLSLVLFDSKYDQEWKTSSPSLSWFSKPTYGTLMENSPVSLSTFLGLPRRVFEHAFTNCPRAVFIYQERNELLTKTTHIQLFQLCQNSVKTVTKWYCNIVTQDFHTMSV